MRCIAEVDPIPPAAERYEAPLDEELEDELEDALEPAPAAELEDEALVRTLALCSGR